MKLLQQNTRSEAELNVSSPVCADDRGHVGEELRLHPDAAERDEPPEAGHEPRRPAPPLPHAAPPQLQQEAAAAGRQDLLAAGGGRGRSARHAPLKRPGKQRHTHTRFNCHGLKKQNQTKQGNNQAS